MPPSEPFLAAAVQMRSGLDRRRNVESARALIAEAAAKGARFVATPEMTNALDRDGRRLLAGLPEEAGLEEIGRFAETAREHKLWLLIGSMAVRLDEKRAANRSFLFSPSGTIVARYDKLHMFDVDLPGGEKWTESRLFAPGRQVVLVATDIAWIGLSICYDLRFALLYRRLAQAGAELLCVPAAFTRPTGEAHWSCLLRARAIENGAFVIAPAQGGVHEDGRATWGRSAIIGPWGDVLAEAAHDEPCVILAEINPARVHETRARIPSIALEVAPEVHTIKP